MNRSENIAELATALAKAQGEMKGASKDNTNPHFKSRYADLASVWDACRAALTANGLSVVQNAEASEYGGVMFAGVETVLMHASGQWMSSRLVVPVTKMDAQGVGSALTYVRRYSLAAMVGVAPEDDDGNAAVAASKKEPATTLAKVIAANTKPTDSEMLTTDRMAELDGITDADGLREWCGRLGAWYLDLQGEDKEAVRGLLTKQARRFKVDGPVIKGWMEGKETT